MITALKQQFTFRWHSGCHGPPTYQLWSVYSLKYIVPSILPDGPIRPEQRADPHASRPKTVPAFWV